MYGELVKLCFVHSVLNDLLLLCITLRITVPIRVQIVQLYHEPPCSSIFQAESTIPKNWKYRFQCFQPCYQIQSSSYHQIYIPIFRMLPFYPIFINTCAKWFGLNLVEQQHSVSSVLYKYRQQKVADISLLLRLRCGNN